MLYQQDFDQKSWYFCDYITKWHYNLDWWYRPRSYNSHMIDPKVAKKLLAISQSDIMKIRFDFLAIKYLYMIFI